MPTAQLDLLEAAAYRESVKHDLPTLTAWLLEHVGQRITAAALGLSDASVLARFKQGEVGSLRGEGEERLRLLYRVARTVTGAFDDKTARAFLTSSNPQLGDRSPIAILGDGKPSVAKTGILAATQALIKG